MSFVSKDVQLQSFETYIISLCQLNQVVLHISFALHASKKI
jgi:hypothetical protein